MAEILSRVSVTSTTIVCLELKKKGTKKVLLAIALKPNNKIATECDYNSNKLFHKIIQLEKPLWEAFHSENVPLKKFKTQKAL